MTEFDQAAKHVDLLGKFVDVGTADRPRRVRIYDLALERIDAFVAHRLPAHGERGGTVQHVEAEDRIEETRVARQAARDAEVLPLLTHTLAAAAEELWEIALRYSRTIDASKLPKPEQTVPGCVSCARQKRRHGVMRGGFFQPIDEKNYPSERLCRWCGDYARSDAIERGLDPVTLEDGTFRKAMGDYPPIEVVDIRHRQSERAAGNELARRRQKETQRQPA